MKPAGEDKPQPAKSPPSSESSPTTTSYPSEYDHSLASALPPAPNESECLASSMRRLDSYQTQSE
ncbi:hypothetical protein FRC07_014612, partial [Ceratobasidium sp. 392]